MKINKVSIALAAAVLVAVLCVAVGAQEHKSAKPADHVQAITAVRLINSAELAYDKGSKKDGSDAHGRYATWAELNDSGVLRAVQDRWSILKEVQFSASGEPLPEHRLDLIVATDGKSYSLALHDLKEGEGMVTVFSDQNGVIFLGSPLE